MGSMGDISVEKKCSYDSSHPESSEREALISQKNDEGKTEGMPYQEQVRYFPPVVA